MRSAPTMSPTAAFLKVLMTLLPPKLPPVMLAFRPVRLVFQARPGGRHAHGHRTFLVEPHLHVRVLRRSAVGAHLQVITSGHELKALHVVFGRLPFPVINLNDKRTHRSVRLNLDVADVEAGEKPDEGGSQGSGHTGG